MATKLIVAVPFADYPVGAEITDPDKVKEVLASSNHTNVRKVSVSHDGMSQSQPR